MMSGSVALALLEAAALTGSETVLVEAGATGVGAHLVEMAREFGAARVIATAGGPDKIRRAKELGADDVLDHRDEHWPGQLREEPGRTIDIVFDSLGGASAAALLETMTPGSGRMLSYGWLSGEPARVTAADLISHGLTLTGCSGPAWHGRVARARAAILERVPAPGAAVETILPLDRASAAHELLESRAPLGKIIPAAGPGGGLISASGRRSTVRPDRAYP